MQKVGKITIGRRNSGSYFSSAHYSNLIKSGDLIGSYAKSVNFEFQISNKIVCNPFIRFILPAHSIYSKM